MKLTVLIVTLLFIVSCQNKERIINDEDWVELPNPNRIDTTKIADFRAVIKHNDFNQLSLTDAEIKWADSLLLESVDEYNDWAWGEYEDSGLKPRDFLINLRYYVRQYEPKLNEDGEKVVVIYGICLISGDRWREGREYVSDGGNCFFEVEVNLTANTAGKLYPNGQA